MTRREWEGQRQEVGVLIVYVTIRVCPPRGKGETRENPANSYPEDVQINKEVLNTTVVLLSMFLCLK